MNLSAPVRVASIFSLALIASACGSTGDSCDYGSTFEAIQSQIFDANGCTSPACHGNESSPTGGLDLRDGFAHANLLGVDATSSPMKRVFSGDHELSALYLMLEAKTLGKELPEGFTGRPMPLDPQPALTEEELAVVAAWIRAGAQQSGIVAGTEKALGCEGLAVADPNKIEPLVPPDPDEGVQLYAGGWDLPGESEDEVCYASYYDFSGFVPEAARTDCPAMWGGGPGCFSYGRNELAQDPQSHHSIITVYASERVPLPDDRDYDPEVSSVIDPSHSAWGEWTCLGGDAMGQSCDPKNASACGPRSQCATQVQTSLACVGYDFAPMDFSDFGAGAAGGMSANRQGLAGAQESTHIDTPLSGVYAVIPLKGFIAWNSHAFNLTTKDTTIEQWVNLDYVKGDTAPDGRLWLQHQIFEADDIFAMTAVAPFAEREVCTTWTLPRYSRLMSLSSHMHQRGELFRIWGPPQTECRAISPACVAPALGDDDPSFMYLSRVYNDAVNIYYDPPLGDPALTPDAEVNPNLNSEDPEDRTFLACAQYDNGAGDPMTVKRHSTRPNSRTCNDPFASVLAGCGCDADVRACLGGPDQGKACNGNDSECAGVGVCDACPLAGGITTDDEMFIPLGTYFVQPPDA